MHPCPWPLVIFNLPLQNLSIYLQLCQHILMKGIPVFGVASEIMISFPNNTLLPLFVMMKCDYIDFDWPCTHSCRSHGFFENYTGALQATCSVNELRSQNPDIHNNGTNRCLNTSSMSSLAVKVRCFHPVAWRHYSHTHAHTHTHTHTHTHITMILLFVLNLHSTRAINVCVSWLSSN